MENQVVVTKKNAGVVCALVALALCINTLDCGFCFDDRAVVLENPDVWPNVSWANLLKNDFWGTPMYSNHSHKSYRPLCTATFRLNYLVHELQPMGYHLVNVLLHSAVCYLYVQLCGLVFREVWPALIAGLLFAVHPIHTEAVAGIVGRAELMSALFLVLSLLWYKEAARKKEGKKWLCLSLVLCLCSVLSKEQGITVLAVCIVYDFFVVHKGSLKSTVELVSMILSHHHQLPRWFKPFVKRTLVVTGFAVVFMLLRLWLMRNTPTFSKDDNEALSLDTPYRQLHWAYLSFANSWLLLNPSLLRHDWRMGAIPLITSVTDPRNLLTLVTWTTVAFLGMHSILGHQKDNKDENFSHRRQGMGVIVFGMSMIIFPYLPASNLLFPVGFVLAERVLYLPSMGFCLLVGCGLWYMLKSSSPPVKLLAKWGLVLLLLSHSCKTVMRNRDWYSKLTLYSSVIQVQPTNGYLLSNIGKELKAMGNDPMAEGVYKRAIEVAPNISVAYQNYGVLLKSQNRWEEAEVILRRALELMTQENKASPEKFTRLYVTIANIIANNYSRLDEALELCNQGISLYHDLAESYNSKGAVLLRMGNLEEARLEFETAIARKVEYPNAHYNLGLTLMQLGDKKKAIQSFRRVLEFDADHRMAKSNLQELLQENGSDM